ncbi:MAG: sigma-70 family RNA polymerase sigma factor [Oscillospiraceae bacterium]|nr:sigma-70 family RNA polymerase sigma factor [Oscillospiraceae bacterium]
MMNSVTGTNQDSLYLDYKDKVTAYVRSRIENKYDVEDIVSTVFLKIYQKIDSFDESKASLSTWIYTITRNTVIDYFREIKIHIDFLDEIEADTLSADSLVDDELLEDLADALETLSERERDLIILHYYKGYTLKRISEMMDMSYINAKLIHTKALSMLRLYMRIAGGE